MSSSRVCSLWQLLLHPAAAATCVFPCTRVWAPRSACAHVCPDLGARAPPPCQTCLSFLGKMLIQSNFFPLPSCTQSWLWIMSNNIQLRRMQINLIPCSPAMQLAAHLRDTKLVYTWYTKSAGWFHQSLQTKREKKKKRKDLILVFISVRLEFLLIKELFPWCSVIRIGLHVAQQASADVFLIRCLIFHWAASDEGCWQRNGRKSIGQLHKMAALLWHVSQDLVDGKLVW